MREKFLTTEKEKIHLFVTVLDTSKREGTGYHTTNINCLPNQQEAGTRNR